MDLTRRFEGAGLDDTVALTPTGVTAHSTEGKGSSAPHGRSKTAQATRSILSERRKELE